MKFVISGKIKAKQRPRFGRSGVYTPLDTVNYENYIKIIYQNEINEFLINPLKMVITAYFQMPASKTKTQNALDRFLNSTPFPTKKPDADNIGKIVADSLNGVAYKDDAQIVDMQIIKKWSMENTEYLEVEIIELK